MNRKPFLAIIATIAVAFFVLGANLADDDAPLAWTKTPNRFTFDFNANVIRPLQKGPSGDWQVFMFRRGNPNQSNGGKVWHLAHARRYDPATGAVTLVIYPKDTKANVKKKILRRRERQRVQAIQDSVRIANLQILLDSLIQEIGTSEPIDSI